MAMHGSMRFRFRSLRNPRDVDDKTSPVAKRNTLLIIAEVNRSNVNFSPLLSPVT